MRIKTVIDSIDSGSYPVAKLKEFGRLASLPFIERSGEAWVELPPSLMEDTPLFKAIVKAASEAGVDLKIISRQPVPTSEELSAAELICLIPPIYYDKVLSGKGPGTLKYSDKQYASAGKAKLKANYSKLTQFLIGVTDTDDLLICRRIRDEFEGKGIPGIKYWDVEPTKTTASPATEYYGVSIEDSVGILDESEYLTMEKPLFTLASTEAKKVREIAVSQDETESGYAVFIRPKIYEILTAAGVSSVDWQIVGIE